MLEELRSASEKHPTFCVVNPPVGNVYFAAALREDGLALPDELLALYSAHDGFDLSCISDPPHIPVFSLLAGLGIDECDAQDGYPRRAACFQGGDEVLLSVYRDRRKQWWLVYEYEYVPVAKKRSCAHRGNDERADEAPKEARAHGAIVDALANEWLPESCSQESAPPGSSLPR